MSSALRRLFVGGNWKCNNTLSQTKDLLNNTLNKIRFDKNRVGISLIKIFLNPSSDVIVAPVSVQLQYVLDNLNKDTGIQVSAQNTSATGYGAFTGEIA